MRNGEKVIRMQKVAMSCVCWTLLLEPWVHSVLSYQQWGGMYKGDRAVSDGMECLLEETLDKAEHPLTGSGLQKTSPEWSNLVFWGIGTLVDWSQSWSKPLEVKNQDQTGLSITSCVVCGRREKWALQICHIILHEIETVHLTFNC